MSTDRPTGPISPPGGPGGPGGFAAPPEPGSGYPPGAEPGVPGGPYPAEGYGPEGMPPIPPEGAEPAEKRRSPIVVIGLMVLAVVVIGAAVYFLFLRGEGERETRPPGATPGAPRRPVPTPEGAVTETPSPTTSPFPSPDPGLQPDVSESFQQYSARNPFKCTFACPIPATTTTGTGGPAPSPSPTPSPQGGTTAGTQQPATGGTSVTLKEIVGGSQAVVQVAGQTYTVAVGESFAGNYKLTRIAGNCASFVQGDSPFTLCTGQSVLK